MNNQINIISLADIYETAGMKRHLSAADYEQLKSNLANNPLVNPIVVKPRVGGGYQIISGHNRVQAYRELNRTQIEAIVREFGETELVEAAFYSNLISSPLSDYEKYLGFKKIQGLTGETRAQLSFRAGVSEAQMSQIFSFGHLSEQAHELLQMNPSLLGYNTVAKMKSFSPEKVTDAIRKLANGQIRTEKDALTSLSAKIEKSQPSVTEFRSGKRLFAKVTQRENLIAIDFKNQDKLSDFQVELAELLKKYADS